jgi:hypothetical protein
MEAYGTFGEESAKVEPCMLIADEVGPRGIFWMYRKIMKPLPIVNKKSEYGKCRQSFPFVLPFRHNLFSTQQPNRMPSEETKVRGRHTSDNLLLSRFIF